jgi:antibiotic biosynthesis monooxygenase (ABM) superfamily enzyme
LTSITDVAVTKIVDRVPRAGMQAQLERAIQQLTQACMRFPGYLGITVLRPALPSHPAFRLIYKFATTADLRTWEESEEQHRLVRRANRYTQGAPRHHAQSGLEAWFTPASSAAPYPSRAKLTFVSWLGVFPLVYVYAVIAGRVLPVSTPAVVRILIVTAIAVPTMSYLVGPWLTRLFRRWLASA